MSFIRVSHFARFFRPTRFHCTEHTFQLSWAPKSLSLSTVPSFVTRFKCETPATFLAEIGVFSFSIQSLMMTRVNYTVFCRRGTADVVECDGDGEREADGRCAGRGGRREEEPRWENDGRGVVRENGSYVQRQ